MLRLATSDPAFERKFARVVEDRRESGEDVSRVVSDILDRVRQRGDEAVAEYTLRFDKHTLAADEDWRISPAQCAAAFAALDPNLRDALELAAARIRAYHLYQLPRDRDFTDDLGIRLGATMARGRQLQRFPSEFALLPQDRNRAEDIAAVQR
jgi:histidinol dehydrogenase